MDEQQPLFYSYTYRTGDDMSFYEKIARPPWCSISLKTVLLFRAVIAIAMTTFFAMHVLVQFTTGGFLTFFFQMGNIVWIVTTIYLFSAAAMTAYFLVYIETPAPSGPLVPPVTALTDLIKWNMDAPTLLNGNPVRFSLLYYIPTTYSVTTMWFYWYLFRDYHLSLQPDTVGSGSSVGMAPQLMMDIINSAPLPIMLIEIFLFNSVFREESASFHIGQLGFFLIVYAVGWLWVGERLAGPRLPEILWTKVFGGPEVHAKSVAAEFFFLATMMTIEKTSWLVQWLLHILKALIYGWTRRLHA